ncbi:MAG TPA: BTAD domain-containing putative transcriptional regulator [Reyranella sp.]|nr:BTAD domain-containing putative transcriptional regulator [Reyranella sp.]
MPMLRIQLLGHLSIQGESHSLDHLGSTRANEVLCYLLLHHHSHHPREHLAEALWDGLPTAEARKHLRQALWHLQTTLQAICGDAARLLMIDADWIAINLDDNIWLDLDAFARAYVMVRGIGGEALDAAQVDALQVAIALYHGDLLEGWYHPWCVIDRERYQKMHFTMLDKMMAACEARGAYEEAVDYGARILGFDRARESTHLRLMRLYYMAGDRTAALRQFDRCVEALREDLDVCPARRTDALYHQIRADRMDAGARPILGAETPVVSLPDVLSQLHQVQATLDGIRSSVQQQIVTFEHAREGRPAIHNGRPV